MKYIVLCLAIVGCSHAAEPAHVPSSNTFTVSPRLCHPTDHQPDSTTGLVSVLCVSEDGTKVVGILVPASDWLGL